jgi:hypothetical protein
VTSLIALAEARERLEKAVHERRSNAAPSPFRDQAQAISRDRRRRWARLSDIGQR